MKTRTLLMLSALTLAYTGILGVGCAAHAAPAATPETAGQYVDGTVITSRVKAALLEEPTLKSFQIGVQTVKDVVQLSGFVDSAAAVRRAGQVAAAVKGVATVRNDLLVK